MHQLSGLRLGQVRVTRGGRREATGDRRPTERESPVARRLSRPWLELHRTSRGASFIGITPTQVLNAPAATGMGFWSLNPYVGCEFGCAYCYARETHQWMVERAANHRDAPDAAREAARFPLAEGFERRILVKETAPEVLARTLDPEKLGDTPVVIGSATDPYQPAERRFKVTRRVLEVFLRYEGLHLGIITKSALIARDAELLAALSQRHAVSVHFSIASLDRELLRRLEPRSPAPHARLRTLRRLASLGVSTDVLIMPILPGLTDGEDELRELMRAAKDAGAEAVAGGAVRMGPATRNTLLPWLDRHRPALAARYRRHFEHGEYVSPDYARALKARLSRLQTEVGFDAEEGERRERRVSGTPRYRKTQGELFETRQPESRASNLVPSPPQS